MSTDHLAIQAPHQPSAPPPAPDRPPRRRDGARVRGAIATALVVLLVLGLAACAYLFHRLDHPNDEPLNPFAGAASVATDSDRRQATAVAEQFALRMDDVDGTDFDGYVAKIEQLLTTKAKTENAKVFDTMGQTYERAKIKGTGKVLLSGVAEIDPDSATVLVAHDASVTTTQGDLDHHYRWTVDLVKVDGTWLVDAFTPVG